MSCFLQVVMRDLVKRYVMKRQKAGQTEGVTEDDLNEIKQDISSFRYELLEILRNNGMKTPSGTNLRMNNSKTNRTQRRKRHH
jgi:transient receptor potential cation channel subfamily C